MSKNEIESILRMVKAMYPTFKNDPIAFDKWCKILKDYEFNEVDEALDKYILEYPRENPTPGILVNGLQTIEQKKLANSTGFYYCSRCGKRFLSIEESEECSERDSSIKYIKKMSNKLSLNPERIFGDLRTVTLKKINDNYTAFIKEVIIAEKEKELLNKFEKAGINAYWKNVVLKEKNYESKYRPKTI